MRRQMNKNATMNMTEPLNGAGAPGENQVPNQKPRARFTSSKVVVLKEVLPGGSQNVDWEKLDRSAHWGWNAKAVAWVVASVVGSRSIGVRFGDPTAETDVSIAFGHDGNRRVIRCQADRIGVHLQLQCQAVSSTDPFPVIRGTRKLTPSTKTCW